MTIEDVKDAQTNNTPLYWERKSGDWRKVLVDEVVEEVEMFRRKEKLDPPMIFVKVVYRGYRICIDEAYLGELYYERNQAK